MSAFTTFRSMARSLFAHCAGKQPRRRSRHAQRPLRRLVCENLEDRTVPSAVSDILGSVPLSFEANHGQADARVQFLSHGPGYGLSLTGTEAGLSLKHSGAAQGAGPQPSRAAVLTTQLVGGTRAAGDSS